MKRAINIIIKIIAVYIAFMLALFVIGKVCLTVNGGMDDGEVLVYTHLMFSVILYIGLGIRYAAVTDIPQSKFYFYIPVAVASGALGFIVSRFAWYLASPLDMLGKLIFKIEEGQKTETFVMLEFFLFTAVTSFVIYDCLCAYRKNSLKKFDTNTDKHISQKQCKKVRNNA